MTIKDCVAIDCEIGRKMGCSTFCCKLIVRLTPAERERGLRGVEPGMNCVPKASDGWCVHLDRRTKQCKIWSERPSVCREYDCNQDSLLQVVLEKGLRSLTELVNTKAVIPGGTRIRIPRRDEAE